LGSLLRQDVSGNIAQPTGTAQRLNFQRLETKLEQDKTSKRNSIDLAR
jgi:hypothetical protein